MVLANTGFLSSILDTYAFECVRYEEDDGTITLSSISLDIVENGKTEQEARDTMAKSILEYANEFYDKYDLWSKAQNRKEHIPYVFKALLLDDTDKISELIRYSN